MIVHQPRVILGDKGSARGVDAERDIAFPAQDVNAWALRAGRPGGGVQEEPTLEVLLADLEPEGRLAHIDTMDMTVWPIVTLSRFFSNWAARMRRPLRRVPFLEPRSSMDHRPEVLADRSRVGRRPVHFCGRGQQASWFGIPGPAAPTYCCHSALVRGCPAAVQATAVQ